MNLKFLRQSPPNLVKIATIVWIAHTFLKIDNFFKKAKFE